MKLRSIGFKNYKAFKDYQEIELKPITLVFGKNSSGKSSVLKLLSILSTMSKCGDSSPFILNNEDVCLGTSYEQIFHNGLTSSLSLYFIYESGQWIGSHLLMNQGKLFSRSAGGKNATYIGEAMEDTINAEPDTEVISDSLHETFYSNVVFENLELPQKEIAFETVYIGPIRSECARVLTPQYNPNKKMGKNGANAYTILLESYLGDKELFENVSNWCAKHLGCALEFERNGLSSGYYSLCVKQGDILVNIADVGQGVMQVLPIITLSFMDDNSAEVCVLEQPALHLHPAAHQSVARRLVQSALTTGKRYIIESHSENLLLSFRAMVAKGELSPDDIVIYFVENDGEEQMSYLERITIDTNGELSKWPYGVFGEGFEILKEMYTHNQ